MNGKRTIVAVLLAASLLGTQALGSGGPPLVPDYVTAYALNPEDIGALSAGHLGILKGAAPSAVLYIDWRLLHGWTVGTAAGTSLATPCCGSLTDRSFAWAEERNKIPGVSKDVFFVSADRPGPDYTSVPTCFADAFDTAVKTLDDRMTRYGATSPAVRAWVAAQDAVFQACSKPGVTLPPAPADAPAWLIADRAYQTAAIALYDGRLAEAEAAFAAIGRDPRSPWQPNALYLQTRVIQRAALLHPGAAGFARAHAALDTLAATPVGTYGRGEVGRMREVLEYHEHPRALLTRLAGELNDPVPTPDIAVKFKDYMSLARDGAVAPEAADWIHTVHAKDRVAGLAHAQARLAATHSTAWLVAALSLAMPDDPDAAALSRAANAITPADPAWLTAQYHLIRLTSGRAGAQAVRTRSDAVLAQADLTRSDRNIFSAIRTQVATGLDDFVRFGLRRPYCTATDGSCIMGNWAGGDGLLGKRGPLFVGWGGDARAIIDRLPMAPRIHLASDARIPTELRLDIALTSFARAVQLQDDAAVDALAGMLVRLLPQVATDWRTIGQTRPGADKRFAEFFLMAKIPTLRTDLASYVRPEGTIDRDFGGYWIPWMIVAPGVAAGPRPFPPDRAYLPQESWEEGGDPATGGSPPSPPSPDLTCLTQCGAGTFPLRMPPFSESLLASAMHERRSFLVATAANLPSGATSVWDEALAYVRARPRDPRAAEMLYRLIRVARWGGNHDHVGRRAFTLLHARYPGSTWARRSPFFYDDKT